MEETPNLITTQPKAAWSQLPRDIFNSILERLSPLDHIRVSCVCKLWRSMTPKFQFHSWSWLILPSNCNDNYCDNTSNGGEEALNFLGLVNLSDPNRELHKLRLPEAAGRLVSGSSAGWLVTLQSDGDIRLLHPFTRDHIQLPRLTFDAFSDIPMIDCSLRRIFVEKAIVGVGLSSNGSSSSSSFETDGVVMVICQKPKRLAFYRSGKDQNWASFESYSGIYKDIAFHDGRFYAIRNKLQVFVACGLDGPSPTMEELVQIPCYTQTKYYLVGSSGDLLLVLRHHRWNCLLSRRETCNFRVFKLDIDGRLTRLDNLGNSCLFLDPNTAVSVSASDIRGYKSNHIYFIGTCFDIYSKHSFGNYDMGVFNLEDKTIKPFSYCKGHRLIVHSPIWYPTYNAGAACCNSGCSRS